MQIKRSEIDAAIATEVMGWRVVQNGPDDHAWLDCIGQATGYGNSDIYPHLYKHFTPSTDANQALELLKHVCRENGWTFELSWGPETSMVEIRDGGWDKNITRQWVGMDDETEVLCCMVALEACGVEVDLKLTYEAE